MKEGYWKRNELKKVDPTSEVNFLPLTMMYMGAKVTLLLATAVYIQRPHDVQYFLTKVREFFVEAACQIRKRFPIGDPKIEMFQVLDPNANHSMFPSLVPLAATFSIIPESMLQQLDDQWRRLAIINLPFDKEDMEPEEFWGKLFQVKDGAGSAQFEVLCNFMFSLLSLPHANVDVERIFSSVNLIKTKTRNWLITSTVRALLVAKDGIKLSGGCVEFSPSSELRSKMNADTLYNTSMPLDNGTDSEEDED